MRPPLKILGATVLVVLAGSVGYAGGTQQAPVEVRTITNTEKVEVDSVPQSCLTALRYAKEGFKSTGELAEVVTGILEVETAVGMKRILDNLSELADDIPTTSLLFRSSATDCESASR